MLHCPQCSRSYADGANVCAADGAALRADATISAPAAPADKLIGRLLDGKYRLDERLGEGGMGAVYRATHLLIERPVALKVLHPRFVEDESAQQRFRREARAAGRLRHPNAVAVTDFGDTPEGYVYIVMELLEGRTLREVLAAEAPLQFGRAVSLMSQAAAAVGAAHEAGVIHRDLKPGNIFVAQRADSPPAVKVLDFGIAKLAVESVDDSDAKNLTQTGVMIGTPRYMSPEQCDGETLTPASDVYSLGVILYEMLTGVAPFNGPTPLAVALQHSSKPPRPPRELVPAIPEELERVVLHALAKSPSERPADAGEFRRELTETARGLGLGSAASHTSDAPALAGADAAVAAGASDGETPSGRLVIDLERMRGERLAAAAALVGANDTTVVADTSERAGVSAASRARVPAASRARVPAASLGSAPAPAGSAIANLFPLQARAFTRFQVLMQKRRGWLQWLSQPPVLIAAALSLLVASVVAAGLIKSLGGGAAGAAAENANAAASAPSPTPEAPPTASPTPENAAPKQPTPGRRAGRANASRRARKPPGGNRVKKVLKKIFKPF